VEPQEVEVERMVVEMATAPQKAGVPEEYFGAIHMWGFNAEMYDVLCENCEAVIIWDDRTLTHESTAGTIADLRAFLSEYGPVPVVCGVCSSAQNRAKALAEIALYRTSKWSVISTMAIVSPRAFIREGVFVGDGAYIGPYVTLDNDVCVLPGGKIYHDSVIGAGSVIVGSAHTLGRVSIGRRVWLCAGVCILPDGVIPDDTVISASRTVKYLRPGDDKRATPLLPYTPNHTELRNRESDPGPLEYPGPPDRSPAA
jgi:acetyltransferase-like isoleucine patch superfamily enzyme